jgi:hypothetical protein
MTLQLEFRRLVALLIAGADGSLNNYSPALGDFRQESNKLNVLR